MDRPVWRKSSRSGTGGTGGQECVEVARFLNGIGVRDSKAPTAGHISVNRREFAGLVRLIKEHRLDL